MGQLTTAHQILAGAGLGIVVEVQKKGTSLSKTWVATPPSGEAAMIPPLTMTRSFTPESVSHFPVWERSRG